MNIKEILEELANLDSMEDETGVNEVELKEEKCLTEKPADMQQAEYKEIKPEKIEVDTIAKKLLKKYEELQEELNEESLDEISPELADKVNTLRQVDATMADVQAAKTGTEEDKQLAKEAEEKATKNNKLYNRWKKVKGITEAFKLNKQDKEQLLKDGYKEEDFEQIETAAKRDNTIYDLDAGDVITRDEAIKLLGREQFVNGLARAAFHWTAERTSLDGKQKVGFDAHKLHQKQESLKESKREVHVVAKFQENNNVHEIVKTEKGYNIRYNVVEGKAKSTRCAVKSLPVALNALKKKFPEAEEIKMNEALNEVSADVRQKVLDKRRQNAMAAMDKYAKSQSLMDRTRPSNPVVEEPEELTGLEGVYSDPEETLYEKILALGFKDVTGPKQLKDDILMLKGQHTSRGYRIIPCGTNFSASVLNNFGSNTDGLYRYGKDKIENVSREEALQWVLNNATNHLKRMKVIESQVNEAFTEMTAVKKAFPGIPQEVREIIAQWYENEGAIEDFRNATEFAEFMKDDIVDMLDAAWDEDEANAVRKALGYEIEYEDDEDLDESLNEVSAELANKVERARAKQLKDAQDNYKEKEKQYIQAKDEFEAPGPLNKDLEKKMNDAEKEMKQAHDDVDKPRRKYIKTAMRNVRRDRKSK